MYGIINTSIEELVIEKFGAPTWEEILIKSGIKKQIFLSSEAYDDAITYQLASSTADVVGVSIGDVLLEFGKWWILHTCQKRYGSMLKTGGGDLAEFLIGLPSFHSRVQLMYPKLSPPEFKVEKLKDQYFKVHYYSKRPALQEFMRGLLLGLATYFKVNATVQLLQSREQGFEYEIFEISWN
ncbi:MAG: heme NO-binding protein [Chitinophagaceae bacterium BSSC1]|nr:MAG: heme NO-binding protein [Chitinophagaceae bacterium BSSC1]